MFEEPHEKPVPRHLLLKVLLVHVVMFVVFYLTGMWAISDL